MLAIIYLSISYMPFLTLIILVAVLAAFVSAWIFYAENARLKRQIVIQMEKANELAKLIFDTNPMCCGFFKQNCEIFDCNNEFLKMLELTDKKELLEHFFEFSPGIQSDGTSTREAYENHLKTAFESGTDRFEWIHQKRNGEYILTDVFLVRAVYENENIVIGYIRDMREFNAMLWEIQASENNLIAAWESAEMAARKLQKSESQLQAWISSSNSPILIVDDNFHIVFVNETFRKLSGYAKEELVGAPSRLFFDDLEENATRGVIEARQQMEQGKIDNFRAEVAFQTRDGCILWGDFNATAIRDTDGELTQIFIVYLDITDRLKMMMDLDHARILAEEANRSKSRFLATISHELRTPMNGIIGLAELILSERKEKKLPPKLVRFVKGIRDSGKSLYDLLNGVLEFAALGSDTNIRTEEPFDVLRVVENILSAHLLAARSKQLELAGSFGPDIPKTLVGDETRLRQMIHHLISNGIKFTKTGKVHLRLERERIEDEYLFLRTIVSDTGVGMTEGEIEQVFEIFYIADGSYSRQQGGGGIGLALVRKIVDTLNGFITLESPGKNLGTTITIVIPYRFDTTSERISIEKVDLESVKILDHEKLAGNNGPSVENMDTSTGITSVNIRFSPKESETSIFLVGKERTEVQRRQRQVLIVEDNHINRIVASEIMKKAGYKIVLAQNGLEACEIFSQTMTPQPDIEESDLFQQEFDVILMDCQMPIMDGFEATEKIRSMEQQWQANRRTPIIALTANTSQEDEDHCMSVGMDAFCSKPVDAQKLLHYVNKFLD